MFSLAVPTLAASIDLSVSAYTQQPDPVARGGAVTLETTVTNNDNARATSGAIVLRLELPTNIDFAASATPGGCVFDLAAAPKTLTCTRAAALAAGADWKVAVAGKGLATGAVSTRAAVAFSSGDTDANPANDTLTKNVTVQNGANLSVVTRGGTGLTGCPAACTAAAGANVSFVLDASNVDGPDSSGSFQVVANLPAATDFSFTSASGSGWSCGRAGTTVTCNHTGGALVPGAHAAPITIGGQIVRNSLGTITIGASVGSTDNLTGDPVETNNGPSQVVVSITPGTDLRAIKTMVSTATGQTVFVPGEGVTLTLAARNTGTQDATGVTVADEVPPGFAIGALPAACTRAGNAITCSVPGTLAPGATSASFTVPLTVTGSAVSGTNVATVARSAPSAGTNTSASVNYTISAPFAHLKLTKTKTPGVAATGATLTTTIRVSNDTASTSAASGTVTVRDTLDVNERFIPAGSGTNGWNCTADAASPQVVTCTYAIPGTLARGAALPDLIVLTTSLASGTVQITNNACTGQGISAHTPADNSNSCATASATVTPYRADLGIAKSASATALAATDNDLTYTLTVTNAGPDTAGTVLVRDPLPVWYSRNGVTTTGTVTLAGQGTGESCSFGATVSCTIRDLPNGASRTVTINLRRPFASGSALRNTATVSGQDVIDPNRANDSASVNVDVTPVADVQLAGIASAPSPVKVGVALTYTTSIRNNGPSSASGVVLRHRLDPQRVTLSGAPTIIGNSGSCVYVASFGAGAYAGEAGIECSNVTLALGETRQLIFKVIPKFPYPDPLPATLVTQATVSSLTYDRDPANNTNDNSAAIDPKQIDLTVTDTDTGYESLAFGEPIKYQVKVQNNGPSQATVLKLTVRPVPPAQNGAAQPYTMTYNPGLSAQSGATCAPVGGDVVCHLAPDPADSTLAAGASRTLTLAFDTGPVTNGPLGTLVFGTTAIVESAETGSAPFTGDTQAANNQVSESTTQKPRTNLFVASKSVSPGSPFSLNEPFLYTVVVGNLGPSPAARANFSDLLPAGLVVNGSVSATLATGALTTNACSTAPVGNRVQVSCVFGTLPVAASIDDAPNLVTITIPVRAPHATYDGPLDSDIVNTATIGVDPSLSADPDKGNDSKTSAPHRIVKSSIAGSVYDDQDRDNALDTGEKIAAPVRFALYGKDAWGNDVGTAGAPVIVSASGGDFLFDRLPTAGAGGYTIVQTQPAGYSDRLETAGSAGGTVPPAVCDGVANCSAEPAHNTIAAIALAKNTAATGYLFQEHGVASVSGHVFADLDNDGVRDAGEAGIAGVQLTISGRSIEGADVCAVLGAACTVTTDAAGRYSFSVPASAPDGGYTVTETALPSAYFDGIDNNGGTLVASSAGRGGAEAIVVGRVDAGARLDERNFGELPGASIAGSVFIDTNGDAVRQQNEAGGVPGVVITLGGKDYLGNPVCPTALVPSCQVVTDANGNYVTPALPPSDAGGYSVTETPPAGLTHIGTQAGSFGGTIAGAARGAGTGVTGAAVNATSGIVLAAGQKGTDYAFAEAGQSLSGRVYLDANLNGVPDGDETGIAGVVVTLSGTAADGGAVALQTASDARGNFSFPQVRPSSSAGYTLTEFQPAGVNDGVTTSNGNGRAAAAKPVGSGNIDTITSIVVKADENPTGYLFGETPVPLLKPPILNGYVWLDRAHNRVRPLDGSHTGLAGWRNELWQGDKLVCTVSTDSRGFYQFDNLQCPGYEASGLPTGANFTVVFRKDGNNMPAVPVSTGNKGTVPPTGGRIVGITLTMGEAVVEQNLPLDPAGVVYDSLTRKPVAGAVVALSGPPGFDPATQLVGGTQAERQTVGSDGMYQFLLQNGFPSGVYTLTVTAPAAGYVQGPSTIVPVCRTTPRIGALPGPVLVQAQDGAPPASTALEADPERCTGLVAGGARTTQYYTSFHITNGGSAPVVNNHLPLDPEQGPGLVVTKTTPMVNVARGDLVPYTITVRNPQATPSGAVLVRDEIPPGFKYRSGSATRDGVPAEPQVQGRMLSWREPAGIPANGQHQYKLVLMVGGGVGDGEYINRAWADNPAGRMASNVGTATVRLAPDATFDCSDIVGKVFDDRNVNGYQDQDEPGIAGVRLATPRGLLVTTDRDGRFHVACPEIPNADRGSNFVMKLDDRTLPSGYRVTTENPRDVRLTSGKLAKLNFGATVHRVARLELADAAFAAGGERLLPEWEGRLDTLVAQLGARPSVVRIAYLAGKDEQALVRRRIGLLEQELRRRWNTQQRAYPLAIEVEGAQ